MFYSGFVYFCFMVIGIDLVGFNQLIVYFYILKGIVLLLQWFFFFSLYDTEYRALKSRPLSKKIFSKIATP